MKAPERILAYYSRNTGYGFVAFGPQPHFTDVEYVRADLAPDAGVMAELVEAAKAQTAALTAFWEADEAASYAEEYACTEDQGWLTDEQIKAMRQTATDLWQSIPTLTEVTAAILAKLEARK